MCGSVWCVVERLSTGRDNLVVAIISRELVCNVFFYFLFYFNWCKPTRPSLQVEWVWYGGTLTNSNNNIFFSSSTTIIKKNIKSVCKRSGHFSRSCKRLVKAAQRVEWEKSDFFLLFLCSSRVTFFTFYFFFVYERWKSLCTVLRGVKKHKREKLAWEIGWCWCC